MNLRQKPQVKFSNVDHKTFEDVVNYDKFHPVFMLEINHNELTLHWSDVIIDEDDDTITPPDYTILIFQSENVLKKWLKNQPQWKGDVVFNVHGNDFEI